VTATVIEVALTSQSTVEVSAETIVIEVSLATIGPKGETGDPGIFSTDTTGVDYVGAIDSLWNI